MRKQNDEFKESLSNIRELPNYLERINQNIINIEKKIQKENSKSWYPFRSKKT